MRGRQPIALPPRQWLLDRFSDEGRTVRHKRSGNLCTYTAGKGRYITRFTYEGRAYRAYVHRILWKMRFGTEPYAIDHINGDPLDNREGNLREANDAENQWNQRTRRDNTSGVKGLVQRGSMWYGQLQRCGVSYRTAFMSSREDAISALDKLRLELHGVFANAGGGVP